jgi:hypothetical protein
MYPHTESVIAMTMASETYTVTSSPGESDQAGLRLLSPAFATVERARKATAQPTSGPAPPLPPSRQLPQAWYQTTTGTSNRRAARARARMGRAAFWRGPADGG